ncbi:MAG: histidine kinase dimerization/phosphoacceptor domain -containing protein [Bacteroidota bacterium]
MNKKPSIICVDDEQIILNSLSKQLTRSFGDAFYYEFCESAEEAIEVISDTVADGHPLMMVISDQMMPGMCGDEFLAWVFEKYPKCINILLTGQAALGSAINAINKANLFRYLTKPWTESDLINTVEKGIHQYTLSQEKEVLLAEVHHRVKNNLAIVSGLLTLQMLSIKNDDARSHLAESVNRINSIAKVHELLYQSETMTKIDIKPYLEQLTVAIKKTLNAKNADIKLETEIDDVVINVNQAIPLGLLINELVTNSLKHGFKNAPEGTISLVLENHENQLVVNYRDNGTGFKNNVDFNTPKNMGLTLIHTQLGQLEADYDVQTQDGFGLDFSFNMSLPR